MSGRRGSPPASPWGALCSPWALAVLVAFVGGISLGSVYSRGGSSALGFSGGAGGGGGGGAAAPLKRSKSAASAGLRPSGKGAGRRRRRAAAEAAGDEVGEGVAPAPAPAAPPAEEKLGIVPPPPKPDGEPFSLSFYDGKSIMVRSRAPCARGSRDDRRRHLPPPPPPPPPLFSFSVTFSLRPVPRRCTRTLIMVRAATTGGTQCRAAGSSTRCRRCAFFTSRRR
jgi:hypothetical protein